MAFPEDAVAVVTGAASGIGLKIARDLANLGVAVSGWDLSAEGVAKLEADLRNEGGRAIGIQADVTDRSAVRKAFDTTIRTLGGVSFLVNNAGPPSNADISFKDGLLASVGSVQLVTESWLATAGSHGGHVVNISSVAGSFVGIGRSSWYPTAKAGIVGLTRYLARTRPNGIRVNAVAPGTTETSRNRRFIESAEGQEVIARNPFQRPGTPADVSAVVVFLLAPVSEYTNGVLIPIDGGSLVAH